jgi:hypothetical protein
LHASYTRTWTTTNADDVDIDNDKSASSLLVSILLTHQTTRGHFGTRIKKETTPSINAFIRAAYIWYTTWAFLIYFFGFFWRANASFMHPLFFLVHDNDDDDPSPWFLVDPKAKISRSRRRPASANNATTRTIIIFIIIIWPAGFGTLFASASSSASASVSCVHVLLLYPLEYYMLYTRRHWTCAHLYHASS